MAGSNVDFQMVTTHVLDAIRMSPDAGKAMERAVGELKDRLAHYDWVGIYLLRGDMLELGPYRGEPSPHTRIPLGRGVCGAAANAKKTIIVPDVHADPRYLACSIKTRSEIVVPIMHHEKCLGEIDIDSHAPDAFSAQDRIMLESISGELAKLMTKQTPKCN